MFGGGGNQFSGGIAEFASDWAINRFVPGGLHSPMGMMLDNMIGGNPNGGMQNGFMGGMQNGFGGGMQQGYGGGMQSGYGGGMQSGFGGGMPYGHGHGHGHGHRGYY
ncbi:hypothetical protein I4U23_000244 [Adineta vaga]|nr:hypothetical protein I4U23_000244 [Adineta vaga]